MVRHIGEGACVELKSGGTSSVRPLGPPAVAWGRKALWVSSGHTTVMQPRASTLPHARRQVSAMEIFPGRAGHDAFATCGSSAKSPRRVRVPYPLVMDLGSLPRRECGERF